MHYVAKLSNVKTRKVPEMSKQGMALHIRDSGSDLEKSAFCKETFMSQQESGPRIAQTRIGTPH